MKRVLVTGAGGFVGARILQQLAGRWELSPYPHGTLATATQAEVLHTVLQFHPEVILHTAALSDTGYCAAHPEESFHANVELPCWIAQAARQCGAKLVAFSSDQVYAGLEGLGPFSEQTPLRPANVYGRHKREAELRVLDLLPDAVLLRATWLYDLPGYGLPIRGNLPLNLWQAALQGKAVRFSCKDFRGVTYVRQAIENLLPAVELPGGVYNFGSDNDADMLTTACHFCNALGISPTLESADWSRSLRMDTAKAQSGGLVFDTTFAGINRCLQDYNLAALL